MTDPTPEPTRTPYESMGGEAGIRNLVARFYELMDTLPEVQVLRAAHPPKLHGSEQKLFEFFSGWLGGPPLFEQRRGPVFLRRRHLPFSIGTQERDQWLLCMRRALDEQGYDPHLTEAVWAQIVSLADHMRNRPE